MCRTMSFHPKNVIKSRQKSQKKSLKYHVNAIASFKHEKSLYIFLKVLMITMGAQTKKSLYKNPLSFNSIIVSRAKKWSERTKTMYISVTYTRRNGISIKGYK